MVTCTEIAQAAKKLVLEGGLGKRDAVVAVDAATEEVRFTYRAALTGEEHAILDGEGLALLANLVSDQPAEKIAQEIEEVFQTHPDLLREVRLSLHTLGLELKCTK